MSDTPRARRERIAGVPHPLARVLELVRVLRGPGGCPWDREQTLRSMTPYLQEETYEVVDAVAAGEPAHLAEELGDLLFLVLFVAEAAEEEGLASVETVAEAVVEKLVRRHPHVFGEGEDLGTDGALRQWEEIKQAEKADAGEEEPSSLGERPKGLPALTAAYRISEKAGAVGFEWPTVDEAVAKLREETAELEAELAAGADRAALEEELGDVLYSVANLGRYLGIDPERALRGTNAKFLERFRHVERRLRERGRTPSTSDLEEMDALWREAKTAGSADPAGGS